MKTMKIKANIRAILQGALITLSLAGFMIHTRIHTITQNPSFITPLSPESWIFPSCRYFFGSIRRLPMVCTEWISVYHRDRHHGPLRPCPLVRPDIATGYPVEEYANRYPHRLGKVLLREGPVRIGDLWLWSKPAERRHYLPISEYGMVVDSPGRRQFCLFLWQPFMELAMNQFKWFTRNGWILHIVAVKFFFWVGQAIHSWKE